MEAFTPSPAYANIIIDLTVKSIDRPFQYRIPSSLSEEIHPGAQVLIPFGKTNTPRKGYVLSLSATPAYAPEKTKSILSVNTDAVPLQSQMLCLAHCIKERYGCTMNQALKTVLPVKTKITPREEKTIHSLKTKKELEVLCEEAEKKHYKARVRIYRALMENGDLPYRLTVEKLGITAASLKPLEKMGILEIKKETIRRTPVKDYGTGAVIPLNDAQQAAVEIVKKDLNAGKRKTYLLHGITGSGKTEVYMELISHVLEKGRQVIVLIPEISLTYQTVMRFYRRFGNRVSIINSRLSAGERYDQLKRAEEGEVDIMIGPRSALFTPFADLGLIIIDEEHEDAYKSELTPRYDAREVAQMRAGIHGASVILGSATPSVESYYRAERGEYRLLTLLERAKKDSRLANVHIADLREELAEGNRSVFSRKLSALIKDRLEKHEQIMLFMNRRGYANFVSCRSCGEAIRCPHCDVSLTYHKNGWLKCHYCGFELPMPKLCPSCASPYIAPFGTGTQKLEELTKQAFPDAKILRMDADTTAKKGAHEEILQAFSEGEADILIGTQMIVKGHDFPKVTLVGIIAADLSLYAPDYRSAERTFALLVQASGRAGRGALPGDVVIQSYAPDHFSITSAAAQDYDQFYRQELLYRKVMGYPPAVGLLGIQLASADEKILGAAMEDLLFTIQKTYFLEGLSIVGPVNAPIYKLNDIYRKILYIKHESYDILLKVRNTARKREEEDERYRAVLSQYDI